MKRSLLVHAVAVAWCCASMSAFAICIEPDSSLIPGTADLPPAGCTYTTPDVPVVNDLYVIDGLPAGTFIQIDGAFGNYVGATEVVGGTLGGHQQNYTATLDMPLVGHGTLAGFNRFIAMPLSYVETHSAPRTPGTTPQLFPTLLWAMQGQIVGDPDFDLLRITAGTGFGMPSPGHTTLTRLGPPGSNWNVDSFFDITYRIDFVGAPGGQLAGRSGSTTGTARFVLGGRIPEPGTMTLAFLSCLAFIRRHRSRQEAVVGDC